MSKTILSYPYVEKWEYEYFKNDPIYVYIGDIFVEEIKLHPMVKINALYNVLVKGEGQDDE